jgi:hypothetical protein
MTILWSCISDFFCSLKNSFQKLNYQIDFLISIFLKQFSKSILPNKFFFTLFLKTHYKKLAFFWRLFCGTFKKPPQIDVIFPTPAPSIFIFSLFPFHFISFQKSQKRNSVKEKENENDETVSGSASVETVCNLRLGRLTQNRPSPQ